MRGEMLRRLPFDHYARYQLAADVAATVRGESRLRVLDVGGGPGSLAAFLPDDFVVACDQSFPSAWHAPAPWLILGDGAQLPFAEGSFDLVVSLDTLEHVPPEKRDQLLGETLRVARGWVLVACPCDTEGVAEADAALLSFVRRRFGEEFETVEVLTEHLYYGHPDPDDVLAALSKGGGDVARFPSGRLDRWLPMMMLFYELMALGRDDPVERVQAWYNALLYHDDLRAPSYRQAFLVRGPEANGPPLDEVIAGLLPSEPSRMPDTAALEALRTGLTESLATVAEEHHARREQAERALAALEQKHAALVGRLANAEAEVAGLKAFREQVLNHPLVRLRRLARLPRSPRR